MNLKIFKVIFLRNEGTESGIMATEMKKYFFY